MGDSELSELGAVWEEDLSDISDAAFQDAVRAARKRSQFFPKPSDVLTAYEERAGLMRRDSLPSAMDARALPQGTGQPLVMSDEQAAKNIACAKELLARLQRKMRA